MKILVLAPYYPHPGHPTSGIFNERCVATLKELTDYIAVLAPRPYVPPFFSYLKRRWKTYTAIKRYELKNGVPVYRPARSVVPRMGGAFWHDWGAFLWSRGVARNLNNRIQLDAILSFDLVGVGGLAWRLGRDLGIPASGWATGNDVRFSASSSYGRVVIRALKYLDVIFYQSHELLQEAARLLSISSTELSKDRHIVLPRGIQSPPSLPVMETRNRVRRGWGITNDQVLVLYIGRILRDKGIFELIEAISFAIARDPRITCLIVGSKPGFDEVPAFKQRLNDFPDLSRYLKIVPACGPEKVWEFLCAADIFAFPSHKEGMPNSLLEAMAMQVPVVAYDIPPVREIEGGKQGVVLVKTGDATELGEAILRLAGAPEKRKEIGKRAGRIVNESFNMRTNMSEAVKQLSGLVIRP